MTAALTRKVSSIEDRVPTNRISALTLTLTCNPMKSPAIGRGQRSFSSQVEMNRWTEEIALHDPMLTQSVAITLLMLVCLARLHFAIVSAILACFCYR